MPHIQIVSCILMDIVYKVRVPEVIIKPVGMQMLTRISIIRIFRLIRNLSRIQNGNSYLF